MAIDSIIIRCNTTFLKEGFSNHLSFFNINHITAVDLTEKVYIIDSFEVLLTFFKHF